MNIYDFLFIVQFLVLVVLILGKVYNVMSLGKFYEMKIGFLMFILFLISWFVGFSIFLYQPERLIYSTLFMFGNLLMAINWFFLIIEIMLYLMNNTRKVVGAYKARGVGEERKA